MEMNGITEAVIGAAIEVHRRLGPGLLESSCQRCLKRELELRHIPFEYEKALLLEYKGVILDCGYRIDLLVMGAVVVEMNSIEKLERIHEAQLLTYLKLGHWQVGLVIKFNVPVLRDGIKRRVLDLPN